MKMLAASFLWMEASGLALLTLLLSSSPLLHLTALAGQSLPVSILDTLLSVAVPAPPPPQCPILFLFAVSLLLFHSRLLHISVKACVYDKITKLQLGHIEKRES